MSRTTLCGITAAALTILSVGVMFVRHRVMGDEVDLPSGPNVWKVTMTAQAQADGDARIWTATPLDFHRQHVLREEFRSNQLLVRPPDARNPQRRRVLWVRKAGSNDATVKLHAEFWCSVDHRPTAPMTQLGRSLYAAPAAGEHLEIEPKNGKEIQQIADMARRLTTGVDNPSDEARALFDFVDREIANEPTIHASGGTTAGALQCLSEGSGDASAKSRLLVALLRSRGIQSRLVTGVTLSKGPRQAAHVWVEAWLHNRWLPLCPFYHHFAKLPPTYLVFGFGDAQLVRGRNVRDIESAFLVERVHDAEAVVQSSSTMQKFFRAVSLYMLPPAEQRLVEFLLLLPVAAFLICVFRNVIGLNSFGTFAPALLGLAFRDMPAIPGFFVFASILLVGWLLRRALDRYHLLQVPRVAMMLTLVVLMLIIGIVAANHFELPATRYISLFPLVILSGMIERFWTLETEDGTFASFKTLFITLLIAASVAVTLGSPAILRHLFRYPETLGVIMAGQLLIGRYTGYRLTELFRFRDFLTQQPATT